MYGMVHIPFLNSIEKEYTDDQVKDDVAGRPEEKEAKNGVYAL
jgi:hypothetical protein